MARPPLELSQLRRLPNLTLKLRNDVSRQRIEKTRNSGLIHPGDEEEEVQVPATPERLPPSIAPARLVGEGGEGRGKRKRKMTEVYRHLGIRR